MSAAAISRLVLKPDGQSYWSETAIADAISKMEQNPNAIGHKWRGVVRGLEDEEIEKYARELVEFEATSERRLMLERVDFALGLAHLQISR